MWEANTGLAKNTETPTIAKPTNYQWADDGFHNATEDIRIWGKGAVGCDLKTVMNCDNYQGVYSFHSGGCNMAMGDGSVQLVNDSISPDIYTSMITRGASDIADQNQ